MALLADRPTPEINAPTKAPEAPVTETKQAEVKPDSYKHFALPKEITADTTPVVPPVETKPVAPRTPSPLELKLAEDLAKSVQKAEQAPEPVATEAKEVTPIKNREPEPIEAKLNADLERSSAQSEATKELEAELQKHGLTLGVGDVLRYPTGGVKIEIFKKDGNSLDANGKPIPLTGQELDSLVPELSVANAQNETRLGELSRPILELQQKSPELFKTVPAEPGIREKISTLVQDTKKQIMSWWKKQRSGDKPLSVTTILELKTANEQLDKNDLELSTQVTQIETTANKKVTAAEKAIISKSAKAAAFLKGFFGFARSAEVAPIQAAKEAIKIRSAKMTSVEKIMLDESTSMLKNGAIEEEKLKTKTANLRASLQILAEVTGKQPENLEEAA